MLSVGYEKTELLSLLGKEALGESNAGLEPYSDFYTPIIFDSYGVNHAKYGLGRLGKHNSLVSKSELFTSEDIGLVQISAFKPNNLADVINKYNQLGLADKLIGMLVLDSVIFNQDRHLGNLGLLVDNNNGSILGEAPMYDHNISMICYATDNDILNINNFNEYCVRCNVGPKLYQGDFIDFAKQLFNIVDQRTLSNIQRKLINIQGIKIRKHTKYNLTDYRIQRIEDLIHNQIRLMWESYFMNKI